MARVTTAGTTGCIQRGSVMKRVHCKKEPYTVYAGRPGPWGNPFVIGKDGTRDEVIAKFRSYLRQNLDLVRQFREVPSDAVLGCWCDYHEACHCDVLIESRTWPLAQFELYRVVGPTFVAGFTARGNGLIMATNTAPILRRTIVGKTKLEALAAIKARGWEVTLSSELHPAGRKSFRGWGSKQAPRPTSHTEAPRSTGQPEPT